MSMKSLTAPTTTALLLLVAAVQPSCWAVRHLQIASPLQSLTVWDPELGDEPSGAHSFRSRFLPRFRAGLQAEVEARKAAAAAAAAAGLPNGVNAASEDWASQAASSERQQRMAKERIVEQAYDNAVAAHDAQTTAAAPTRRTKNPNKFQFVGVVNSKSNETPITWYSRPKPANAKWSVRLVHVNRDAILKDLFNRGKIDVFGRYENTGQRDATTNQPIVESNYMVRERVWK